MKRVNKTLAIAFVGVFLIVFMNSLIIAEILDVDFDSDGYNASIDCNDTNPLIFKNIQVFVDKDKDNIGTGGLITICTGYNVLEGYVNSSSEHNDCNDSDSNYWINIFGYTDNDQDGFGSINRSLLCTNGTLPIGYSINSLDCNDSDKNTNPGAIDIKNDDVDQNCDGFDSIDLDSDGYLRFDVNMSLRDCDDFNHYVNPGEIEKCNGRDDNCNGKVDEDFSNKNKVCYVGVGECNNSGYYICNKEGDNTFCKATPKKPSLEVCDSKDNDCDGETDENNVCDQAYSGLFVFSPNEPFYNLKKILFNISTGARIAKEINYIDNGIAKPKITILCKNCLNSVKSIQFTEGNHSVIINAIFENETITKQNDFFIDATIPKVTSPKILRQGFTNGNDLAITYTESNLQSVKLVYKIHLDDINESNNPKGSITRENCPSGKSVNCNFSIDLKEYEGKIIDYYFIVIDKSGNTQYSKNLSAIIDTIKPVIKNPESMFVVLNNRVTFNMNIDETNFNDVSYFDPLEKNARWKLICSRLVNKYCTKSLVFKPGDRTVLIKVTDKAGNYLFSEI